RRRRPKPGDDPESRVDAPNRNDVENLDPARPVPAVRIVALGRDHPGTASGEGGPGRQAQAAASSGLGRSASVRNAPARHAMRIAIAVTATMIVEIALISDVTPYLILP